MENAFVVSAVLKGSDGIFLSSKMSADTDSLGGITHTRHGVHVGESVVHLGAADDGNKNQMCC